MNEEKRNILSVKRKPADNSETSAANKTPTVPGRKKMITVSSPPAWKVKKQKLAEKSQVAEAAGSEAISPVKPTENRPAARHKGVRVMPLGDAVTLMKTFWPELFEEDKPRLLQTGIRESLFEDISRRALPVSHKRVKHCLQAITRSDFYLESMVAGAPRHAINGQVTATIDENEEQYATERLRRSVKTNV